MKMILSDHRNNLVGTLKIMSGATRGKNGFAERSEILARYRSVIKKSIIFY